MKYTHFGASRGIRYESPLYSLYEKEVGQLTLIEIFDEETIADVEDALEKSLDNKKTFYENAKPYIKKEMEDYEKKLNNKNALL